MITASWAERLTRVPEVHPPFQSSPFLQVWWARLNVARDELSALWSLLNEAERERAAAYRHQEQQDRFVATRGWLRRLLGSELGCAPKDVPIIGQPGKKPSLGSLSLRFSVSRSANLAVYATSWHAEVGVDVEVLRPVADMNTMITRLYTQRERKALASLCQDERGTAFLACWTRKEAYLKGTGTGLRVPLSGVDTWRVDGGPSNIDGWTLWQVQVVPGYVAAVAAQGSMPDPDADSGARIIPTPQETRR